MRYVTVYFILSFFNDKESFRVGFEAINQSSSGTFTFNRIKCSEAHIFERKRKKKNYARIKLIYSIRAIFSYHLRGNARN